jgi:hypothetical protein
LIFLLVGLDCWGIFLGSVGCAAGDGESEKERVRKGEKRRKLKEADRCWVCSRSKRRKWEEEREMIIKKNKI